VTVTTARCLIRDLDELLVEETVDPEVGRVYRPLGRDVATTRRPRRPSARRSGRRWASGSRG